MAIDIAIRFLYALTSEWETETMVGYRKAKEMAAMVLIPDMNRSTSTVSDISNTSGVKTLPESKICATVIPYVNGEIFSMFKSAASDGPTLVPAVTT